MIFHAQSILQGQDQFSTFYSVCNHLGSVQTTSLLYVSVIRLLCFTLFLHGTQEQFLRNMLVVLPSFLCLQPVIVNIFRLSAQQLLWFAISFKRQFSRGC